MTILGGDIVETYYLSQLYADDIFEHVLLNHYSSRNLSREVLADLLLTAECDLLISSEPLNIPGIDNQLIDSFRSFVCIFASNHILSTLPHISLHHFYSSRHAMYQLGRYSPMIINDKGLFKDNLYYKGSRIIGYRSDSLNGMLSMIERTSLIALMPLKLALFIKISANMILSLFSRHLNSRSNLYRFMHHGTKIVKIYPSLTKLSPGYTRCHHFVAEEYLFKHYIKYGLV